MSNAAPFEQVTDTRWQEDLEVEARGVHELQVEPPEEVAPMPVVAFR